MASYARVYEAARNALHQVDPSGRAVVGGLADSASYGVDVQSDEDLLNALPRGQVDAVGYHPWIYDVDDDLLRPDTVQLWYWMAHHGFEDVPLDVNEFGACQTTLLAADNSACRISQSSSRWGAVAADYTRWALCLPWLKVESVQAFFWGATPQTSGTSWLPLFSQLGIETAYGKDFLDVAQSLTTAGCGTPAPAHASLPANSAAPAIAGKFASGDQLTGSPGRWSARPTAAIYYQWRRCDHDGHACTAIAGATSSAYLLTPSDVGSTISLVVTAINRAGGASATSATTRLIGPPGHPTPAKPLASPERPRRLSMGLRIIRIARTGHRIRVIVSQARGSGRVTVTVKRPGRKRHARRLRRHAVKGRGHSATTTFTGTIGLGRWVLTVTGKPGHGYAKPKPKRRRVTIGRHRAKH
jgi:hypothetical protein